MRKNMGVKECGIRPEELAGVGVLGLADTPGLNALEMQEKFEETARRVIIPKLNALIAALTGENGAAEIGAQDPVTGERATVQLALMGLAEYIDSKIIASSAGDMQKAVYDPQGKAADVFAAIAETDAKFSGCWISFTDEDGNPADEPHIHWMQEE